MPGSTGGAGGGTSLWATAAHPWGWPRGPAECVQVSDQCDCDGRRGPSVAPAPDTPGLTRAPSARPPAEPEDALQGDPAEPQGCPAVPLSGRTLQGGLGLALTVPQGGALCGVVPCKPWACTVRGVKSLPPPGPRSLLPAELPLCPVLTAQLQGTCGRSHGAPRPLPLLLVPLEDCAVPWWLVLDTGHLRCPPFPSVCVLRIQPPTPPSSLSFPALAWPRRLPDLCPA